VILLSFNANAEGQDSVDIIVIRLGTKWSCVCIP